jgi:iron complex outermembrane receptor protein
MDKLKYLKSALVGGAGVVTLIHPAAAKIFDIPRGDLATALGAYMRQAGVQIVYSDDVVRGHRSLGAKGNYTEVAALAQILRGTGFTAQPTPSSVIGIVPQQLAPVEQRSKPAEQLAQAARRATAPAESMSIETVVVTAQKKKEDIQQVPIAITALSQRELTERQIAGGPDLVKDIPNVTFNKTNFTGYNLEIRGIGTQAISVTTDPAVAVAFNGIPFIRNHFFEQEFFDVDNVEVLRGPQGTLYGRNATAGVVNVVSALPTDSYEAMLSADIGNYDSRRYEGMLNLPIVGDTLDLRIAGEWTKREGYTEDTTTDTAVDGRDLWSGRMTLGWKPASNIQTYLVWEHFSEDDDRLRSGKQLCKTDPGVSEIDGVSVVGDVGGSAGAASFSQGCAMTSLYSPSAFEVPNGRSLPYYQGLQFAGNWINSSVDPYASATQSTNLRSIESAILPTYRAKNDTLEFNTDWTISPELTLTSQTGYNHDFLWSTEDYNRFTSSPGLWTPNAGSLGQVSPSGVFCDPQLGCSSGLVAEDLSEEHAWQISQEFRLASNFDGPLNFSVGGNFLHYETEENYYVFINAITLLSTYDYFGGLLTTPWNPRTSDNSQCLEPTPRLYNKFADAGNALGCVAIDPNPIGSLDNEGHNYFLSQNPYLLNSYAGFGEVYYTPTKDLKFTAGARWTDDQKQFTEIPSWIAADGYGYPVLGVVDQQWDRWTGRGVLDWTPQLNFTDQTLIYASLSHGYKAGGANPPGAELLTGSAALDPTHPLTFKPEYIEAFELGTKNTMLDDALTLNGDVFYYNYSGYQISQIVDRTSVNLNFNAHVEGAELEANWEPIPGLKFGFTGGYEATALAGGSQAIDLMDRTAGMPGWYVAKPFFTYASNCVLPGYVIAALGGNTTVEGTQGACGEAYAQHLDPVTGKPYTPYPYTGGVPTPGAYPGFDPVSPTATNLDPYTGINEGPAPNNGAGFDKNLAGNQLPNAPHFTTSLMAEYTMPVSDDWAATLHTDFSWQSQEWARVFEDPIDKIHGYSNVNVSLILNSSNGWDVMAYVKNVFDTTAITGTFLNSDDTGLTTNVFLTDPRLFGVRVTKHLDEADGFWGSEYNGRDFFTGLFSDADNGKPPLWIKLGGNFDQLSDGQQPFDPPFVNSVPSYLPSPLAAQKPPGIGLDWEAAASFEPNDSDWVFSADIRYGRSSSKRHVHQQTTPAPVPITLDGQPHGDGYAATRYVDTQTSNSESHMIFDFMAGKDVGLGMFDLDGSSVVSGGMRMASFTSNSVASIFTIPESVDVGHQPKYSSQHNYSGSSNVKRSFHGIGPALSWNASTPLGGTEQNGEITIDWGSNAAILFGRQRASGNHTTGGHYTCRRGFPPSTAVCHITSSHYQHTAAFNRSRMATVPNLGGFAGISFKYNNAKVSFGYRADEFFGAVDGGIDSYKAENRGFFGPFANISIGLGG